MTTITTRQKHWRLKFLDALRMHGVVTRAAQEAGIDRDTAYFERKRDPVFAQEWQEALDRGVDMLEDVAKERAYRGSDTLLIFLLKAHRPDVYREKTITKSVNINLTPADLEHMSDDELDQLAEQLDKAAH